MKTPQLPTGESNVSGTDDFWKNASYYFKPGCYVQDNTGTSSEGGRIRVKGVSVSHH
jgi:hypothetical protein